MNDMLDSIGLVHY